MTVGSVPAEDALDPTDDDLMTAYAGGDVAAFEELYGRYESAVYGFCLRFLGDADAAADVFQETFMRVVDGAARYNAEGRFRGWLFTIARRLCTDAVRLQRKRPRVVETETAALASSSVGADALVEQRDEITRCMAMVPPKQRDVLLLHQYFGFGYAEIAVMTGSSESAVKQKAYRALRALRALNR